MAKQVKCPTCGTAIPIPGEITGQVVKCPGCGKGLKLVPKKTPGAPGSASAAGTPHRASSETAGGMTVKSFAGEPGIHDEPPIIDIPCAACGKQVPEPELNEDRGELICSDCLAERESKGPKMAPELFDFAEAPAVVRRGKPITVGPLLIACGICIIIWAGASVYLNLFAKPVGQPGPQAVVPPKPTPGSATKPTENVATSEPATLSTQPVPIASNPPVPNVTTRSTEPDTLAAKPDWEKQHGMQFYKLLSDAVTAKVAGRKEQAQDFYKQAIALTENQDVPGAIQTKVQEAKAALAELSSPVEPANPSPVVVVPTSTAPTETTQPVATSTDPLQVGLEKLKQGDYRMAWERLEDKRKVLMRSVGPSDPLNADQVLCLNALAAACIGKGTPDKGINASWRAFQSGARSRSLILNMAQTHLAALIKVEDLLALGETVRQQMQSSQDDELAANVLGTIIDKGTTMVAAMTPEQKTKYESLKTALDSYNTQLASKHPGMAKWGVEWLPEADVQRFKQAREMPNAVRIGVAASRQLDAARKNLAQLQGELDQATRSGRDVTALKTRVDESTTQVQKLEQQSHAVYYPPHWLEKFEPVLPEGI